MAAPEKRQVVFLMTDTQRWDMLSCQGIPAMQTPCLDRLAAGGVRFERAYTCQPVCGPARAAIFTGQWPHATGAWTNSAALGDNVRTLGQRLQDLGLHTAYIGKWHLDGSDYFGLGRCPDGWDPAWWYDMRNYLDELTPEERRKSRDSQLMEREHVPAEFTFGHRCSNRAIDFLKRHGGEDFFLTVSYDEPHHPFLCPDEFMKMHRDTVLPDEPNLHDDLAGKPEHQHAWAGPALEREPATRRQPRAFLACNSFVDAEIGRVIEAVRRHAPDALILYTSDHGDMLGSHRLGGKGPAMYDEITRVPMIANWPGRIPAGSVCPHPVSHIDLAPTILDCIGAVPEAPLNGRSMKPALLDPQFRPHDIVFMEFGRYEVDHDGFGGFQPVRCVFDGRHKLIINLLSSDELYDLQTDPGELVNLIASPAHAPLRDTLHNGLLNWMNQTRDPFRGYYWERRPWRTDAAPATWNYTGMTRQREEPAYEPRQLDYATGLEITAATRRK